MNAKIKGTQGDRGFRALRWLIVLLAVTLAAAPVFAQAQTGEDTISYRFKRGDTLIALARQYFLDPASYRVVQRVNRIADARRIPVGKAVAIPVALLKKRPAQLQVAGFSGPVQLVTANGPLEVAKGANVPEGTEVRTGVRGFVSFSGTGGSNVTIPSRTRIRIVRARRYLINDSLDLDIEVLAGRGSFSPPKLDEADRYRVRTPVAVSAVRGTRFRVGHEEETGVSNTGVTEGVVKLLGRSEARAVPEGFGVVASPAGLAPNEALLPSPKILEPGKVRTDATVSFAVSPVPGARTYRTQVALDAGFLEMLDESESDAPVAAFDDLPNGTLFVRSRAVAESGIEGFSDVYSFKRFRLGVSASAAQDPLSSGLKFAWQPDGEGSPTFSFRLWHDGDDGSPVIAETGMTDTSLVVTDLPAGTYQWQVGASAIDKNELVEVWGAPQKLTVSN